MSAQHAVGLSPPAAAETLELFWSGARLVSADPPARRMLAAGSGEDDLQRLLSGLGFDDAALAADLRGALLSGRACRTGCARVCGGEVAIDVRPAGRRMAMTVHLGAASSCGPEARSLSAAAGAAAHPIWLRGEDGAVRWRNAACERLGLGLDDPRLRAAAATASATNAAQSLRMSGGDQQALMATESPGGLGMATPVWTERRADRNGAGAVDAALAATEGLSLGVAVFGARRRLIYANAAFRNFWSLPAATLEGRPRIELLLDRMRDSGRLPTIGNYPLWREEIAGWADPLAEAPSEDDWHLADGAALRVERRVDEAARTVLTFRDITAQVCLERRYRRTVSVQRRTLDALDDGVALLDPDGRLRLANPAFGTLWTLDPAHLRVGAHIAEIPAPTAIGAAADAWAELRLAVTGGGGRSERCFRLGGRVLHATASPMPDGSILARIDDRTAAEQAETALRERGEALEAAAELRTALADCASVKLRTALTSISGFAELMALDCEAPALQAQLRAIIAATADMAKAIEEIERLAAGKESGAPVLLTASQLMTLTGGLLSRALWTAEARLEQVNEDGDAVFLGDTESLCQITLAMALAALDGLPPGGVLRLCAGRAEPDSAGRIAAVIIAETASPQDRASARPRLARAFSLAARLGATLTSVDDGGRRTVTLTGVPIGC